MQHISKFDPQRETVGAIYLDAVSHPNPERIETGDMVREMMKGLVEDINDGIASKPFGDQTWYIIVHEKKDLQMKQSLLRRILHSKVRPYPEDDTTVFKHDPIAQRTFFCWSLPHWTDMPNILANVSLYDKDMIIEIKAWKACDLWHFGFKKTDDGNWTANPDYPDRDLSSFGRR